MRTALLILLLTPLTALARQSAEPAPVQRLDTITFDGRVEAGEWDHIPILPVVMYEPVFGGEMSVVTELRLAYDDEYVYLSVRAFDDRPLTMTTYRRDNWSGRDDQVGIAIDTFNDYQNASVFVLYPTGARTDAQLSNDGRDFPDINIDWNTFWDGAVHRHDRGWDAEIRIPVSSLRFETPSDRGDVVMGVAAYRYQANQSELHSYPAIRPDWGFWSWIKPSKLARRSFRGLQSSKPLYVAPYATAGVDQRQKLEGGAWDLETGRASDVGLDAKYSLTSNLTLDATVNTDFAQVEADDQQVNLTRFSLFFPEKRQFFLERTSNFDFSFGGFDRVFYSRRIGLEDGDEVPLLGGGRLVGRVGDWDVGLLSLQTGRSGEVSSENFGVARVKRRVWNTNSFLGAIGTSRTDFDGTTNTVYGVDGQFNVQADDYLRFNWAQSFDSGDPASTAFMDRGRLRLEVERQRSTGLGFLAGFQRAGNAYMPRAGFQLRSDFSRLNASAGYGVRPEEGRISSYSFRAETDFFYRNGDGSLETREVGLEASARWTSQYLLNAVLSVTREDLREGFSLSDDADVPAGRYDFASLSLRAETPDGNRLKTGVDVEFGRFFDGRQVSVSLQPLLSVSPKLALSGSVGFNSIHFPERDQEFRALVSRVRLEWTLNTSLTLSTFVQHVSTSGALIANARLRWNPRDGNDLYLVWNEVRDTERMGLPRPPSLEGRTLIAKYTYTFRW